MKQLIFSTFVVLASLTELSLAQNPQQIEPQPNAPVAQEDLLKLTGPLGGAELSRDINILWLSGPEDHKPGEHDYIRIQELFIPMLESVPRVTIAKAFHFPSQEQFDRADLLIQ